MGDVVHREIYRGSDGNIAVTDVDFYGEGIERVPRPLELLVFRGKEIFQDCISRVVDRPQPPLKERDVSES